MNSKKIYKGNIVSFLIGLLLLALTAVPASGQTVLISDKRINEIAARLNQTSQHISILNGKIIRSVDAPSDKHINLGHLSRFAYSLIALKLAQEGTLDLEEPIFRHMPELGLDEFFTVAITAKHLMSATAGFGVPTWYSGEWSIGDKQFADKPLVHYVTSLRTAGQITHDDPVGALILVKFMEKVTGKSIEGLVKDELLAPLGLKDGAFNIPATSTAKYPNIFKPVMAATGSMELVEAFMHLTLKKPDFLSEASYKVLMDDPIFALQPMGKIRTSGLTRQTLDNRNIILIGDACASDATIISVPRHELSLLITRDSTASACNRLQGLKVLEDIFETDLPPLRRVSKEIKRLRAIEVRLREPKGGLSGIYVRDDAPSRWLKARLDRLLNETLAITPDNQGHLSVNENDVIKQYDALAPYRYEGPEGEELIFTPYKLGGYLTYNGTLYRYVGLIGDKVLVLSPFIWCLLIMLTAAIYWRSKTSIKWRKMAKIVTIGTVLYGAGVYFELNHWPLVYYTYDSQAAIVTWRIIMNIGMMGILAMPIFALKFSKNNNMPQGISLILAGPHLTLLTVASLILFLLMNAWGIAGEIFS